MRSRTLGWTLLLTVLASAMSSAQQTHGRLMVNYGKLPLTFELNRGQSNSEVRFLCRGRGYTAFLTTGGLTLSLRALDVVTRTPSGPRPIASTQANENAIVQFRLLGAVRNPAVVGEEAQPGTVNYFLGNDPAKWHTNVPTYARVRYKNVYPGIDLLYHGNQRQLEYDFEIGSGADPGQIQFEIQGASRIAIDRQSNLVLKVGSEELHFQSPVVYQQRNGRRTPVKGGYVLTDSMHVAFRVGRYDPSKQLVIDPVLVYSTYLGGSGNDQPTGIAVDGAGSVYVAGYTDSADFPLATLGSLPKSTNHVFIAKLDTTGSNLVYADYIGGGSQDYGTALVLDSAHNVYITGSTESGDFPIVNPYQSQIPGPYTGFLTKVSASGSSLLYSTYLGGNAFDQPTSIAIDGLGQVHVAGYTLSQNFPVVNAYQAAVSANQGGIYGNYGFLTKFKADGSSLLYSTYLAGNSNVVQDCGTPCWPAPYNSVNALAIDANGNAYVTGATNTYNFPTTAGAYLIGNTTPQDANVGFVTKFNSAGSLLYSTYFYGSSGNPVGIGAIAIDGTGSAYITGSVVSDGAFPVTSTSICDPSVDGFACSYAFVSKFDPTGSTLMYSTFLGANNYATPQSIVLDANANAFVLASTSSGLFQTSNAIEPYVSQSDLLLVEIDTAAGTQPFSTYLGASQNEFPSGIALDSNGSLYVVGSTNSTDLSTTPGAFQSVLGGNTDAFIVKIGGASAPAVTLSTNSLQFAAQPIGTSSPAQTVLLSNVGNRTLSISSITASGNFSQTGSCAGSLAPGSSCTIAITFTPTVSGSRSGSLTIIDNAQGSPHVVGLAGTGSDFSIASSPTSATIKAGASPTYTLTVASVGGTFANAVKVACSGAPAHASCSVAPNSLTPGSTSATTVLTINTAASAAQAASRISGNDSGISALWAEGPIFGVFGMMFLSTRRRKKNAPVFVLLPLMVTAVMLMSACAGGTGIVSQGQGTPPGTYTINITGTSGTLQHSTSVTLTVK